MEKYRPRIILSAAMTIDGKIASKHGDSKLSSKSDKIRLHKLRSRTDAILVGKNTVLRDDPLLTARLYKGKNPIRIVLDSRGTIPNSSRIVKTCKKIPTIIVVAKNIPKKNLDRLQRLPLDVVITGTSKINLKTLLKTLSKKQIKSILLEGGSKTNWEFIKQGYVDEIIVTIVPCVVGGESAISLVGGGGFSRIANSKKFQLKNIVKLENELVVHYCKL